MAQRLCLLLLAVASWNGVLGQFGNYCQISRQHTLCIHQGLGETCGNQVQFRGVGAEDAALILAQHNQLRSRVALGQEGRGAPGPQPQASNMRVLEWDDELAIVAQSHADQCIFDHECADCRRVSRFGVGQNLFISFQSNFNNKIQWGRAIKAWYDEVAEFDPGAIQPFQFSTPVGHYTQMMWWNTYKIGCGYTMYKEGGWWKKLYTCNYGPGGNIIFSEMYRRGSPCSACPAGTTCSLQYPGLCEDGEALDSTTGFPTTSVPTAVGTTTSTITGFAVNSDNNEADNEITRVPLKPDPSDNGINGFGDFTGINSINPEDVDLAALIEFFNNRRRGMNGMRTVSVLNNISNGRRPGLVTARLTDAAPQSDTETTTAPQRTISTITSPSTTTQPIPTTTEQELTTIATNPATTIISTTTTSSVATTSNPIPPSDIPPTEVSTTTPSSSEGSATTTTAFHTNQLQQRTGTPAVFRTRVPATFSTFPVFHQQQHGAEFEPQEPQEAEFEPAEVEAQEQEEQEFIPMHGQQPQVTDLMPFLQRAGVNTQVIRTQTLSSVQSIINSLPFGLKPIVLFRSGGGQLTELDAGTLLPLRRFGRSTTTTRGPKKSPGELLTCDLDFSPCEVAPVGANWTIGSSPSVGRYTEASLQVGDGAQVVFQKLVSAPATDGVCVAVSHRRELTEGAPTNATIPELMVGIMPLGGEVRRETVGGASGLWEMSRVSFSNVKTPFLVLMTVAPASTPATVAFDALQITDGLCCLSGIC